MDRTKKLILLLFILFTGMLYHAKIFSDPGIFLISKDGKFQVDFSGRLELSAYIPQESPSYLIYETHTFGAGRLSFFSDIFIGNRFYGLVELRIDRGEIPSSQPVQMRLQQAFFRYTIIPSNNIYIQIGKFVSPFGKYSQRHDSPADPFIRPPLLHEYRTVICPGLAPSYNDKFIGWKNVPDKFRPTGAPVIWGVPYQFGVMISGNHGKLSFQAALMNSAPSSDPVQWDLDFNQQWNYSWVGHLGYRISPELGIGLSFNSGPYSLTDINRTLLIDQDINDYKQIMWGVDAKFTLGKVEIRAELVYDTWEVPNVYMNPKDTSYYLEFKYKFFPGFSAALRWNAIYFNKISFNDSRLEKWDYDAQRMQFVIGYRFSRSLETKVEYMWNHTIGPYDSRDNLLAIQWIWNF